MKCHCEGISTAKYSVLSFIPKFLCEQLAKVHAGWGDLATLYL